MLITSRIMTERTASQERAMGSLGCLEWQPPDFTWTWQSAKGVQSASPVPWAFQQQQPSVVTSSSASPLTDTNSSRAVICGLMLSVCLLATRPESVKLFSKWHNHWQTSVLSSSAYGILHIPCFTNSSHLSLTYMPCPESYNVKVHWSLSSGHTSSQ